MKLQFSELWIPNAVAEELKAHPNPDALAAIQAAIGAGWIRKAAPRNPSLLSILLSSLHEGEAEAIALALELKADTILIDEQEGRLLASHAGLSVTGVLGVLLRAKQTGQIPAVEPEIRALRTAAHFFISRSLENSVLALSGEPFK